MNEKRVRLLKSEHYKKLEAMVDRVLEAQRSGEITSLQARIGLIHVMAAIDAGIVGQINSWASKPDVSLFKDLAEEI